MNQVLSIKDSKNKKPGLNPLSSYYLKNDLNLKVGSLGGINWNNSFNNISPFDSSFPNLDVLALDHLKRYWKNYDIDFSIPIEHKTERTFKTCASINKAHYMMLIYDIDSNKYTKKINVIRGLKKIQILHMNILYMIS